MSSLSKPCQNSRSYKVIRNSISILVMLLPYIMTGLCIHFPRHGLLIIRGGYLLITASAGLLVGIEWHKKADLSGASETNNFTILTHRNMLIAIVVLLPLIALGSGISYYSGSHKIDDLIFGIKAMCASATVESLFIYAGLTLTLHKTGNVPTPKSE